MTNPYDQDEDEPVQDEPVQDEPVQWVRCKLCGEVVELSNFDTHWIECDIVGWEDV